jgi:hypothetical protein
MIVGSWAMSQGMPRKRACSGIVVTWKEMVSNHADKIHCLMGDGLSSLRTVSQERKDGFVEFSGVDVLVPYIDVTDEVGCTT